MGKGGIDRNGNKTMKGSVQRTRIPNSRGQRHGERKGHGTEVHRREVTGPQAPHGTRGRESDPPRAGHRNEPARDKRMSLCRKRRQVSDPARAWDKRMIPQRTRGRVSHSAHAGQVNEPLRNALTKRRPTRNPVSITKVPTRRGIAMTTGRWCTLTHNCTRCLPYSPATPS